MHAKVHVPGGVSTICLAVVGFAVHCMDSYLTRKSNDPWWVEAYRKADHILAMQEMFYSHLYTMLAIFMEGMINVHSNVAHYDMQTLNPLQAFYYQDHLLDVLTSPMRRYSVLQNLPWENNCQTPTDPLSVTMPLSSTQLQRKMLPIKGYFYTKILASM